MYQRNLHNIVLFALPAILSACGGGGNDDIAESADSAACFNAGFYRPGTEIAFMQTQTTRAAESVSPSTYVNSLFHRVVGEEEKDGVNIILVDSNEDTFGHSRYAIENGVLLYYGFGNLDTQIFSRKQSLTPARTSVIAMQPGQVTTQNFVQTNEGYLKGIYTQSISNVAYNRTFVGVETVTTSLGQFSACRFDIKTQAKEADSGRLTLDAQTTSWVAATGPYRGLSLKEDSTVTTYGYVDTSATEATKYTSTIAKETIQVNQFDIK
ncbi:hypothetical protein [Comamonas sediminis]|uniref:Lipoprotein n=1 Tax=Comamonas sediminis TaxID=1783360 RepID=A0ABV4B2L8_9BURK